MSEMYKILWIDDEWDKMCTFMEECEEIHNLKLVPYRTRKEGIEALERDLDSWDAVLLDAKMFDESENEVASLAGLVKAQNFLERLSLKKTLPYFISTGQQDLLDDKTFSQMVGKYYVKDKEDEQLIEDIKIAINKSDSTQIKSLYRDVFDALDNMGILKYTKDILLDILLALHYPAKHIEFKPAHHYNQLRQLIEYIFRACNTVGIIPDVCIQGGNVNLNQCSIYLAGRNADKVGIRYGNEGMRVIPQHIENIIRSVLDLGNVNSHSVELTEDEKLQFERFWSATAKSKYMIFGLTHNLCEAIVWFSRYIIDHPDKETNLQMCNYLTVPTTTTIVDREELLRLAKEKYEGQLYVPQADENGVWHCGECIVKVTYWSGGKMRLKDIALNTGGTKNTYPFFAKYDKE